MFTEKTKGKTDAERGLDDLMMPKLEELIFTAVAVVFHLYLAILKMFSRLLCFEEVKATKIFSEKLDASKIKKTRRSRNEKQRPQLQKCPKWHKSSNSQAIRGKYVAFSSLYIV